MPPSLKSWRLWIGGLAVWTAYATIYSSFNYFWYSSAGRDTGEVVQQFKILLANGVIVSALTPPTLVLGYRYPITRRNWKKRMAQYSIALTLFMAIETLLRFAVYPVRSVFTGEIVHLSWVVYERVYLANMSQIGFPMFIPLAGLSQWWRLMADAREREVLAEQLRRTLAEAELQSLKVQLQPHFLFNTLNAVVELIHNDPVCAEAIVLHLSALLRRALRSQEKNSTTVAEELGFLQHYLKIESIRFSQRLQWSVEVEDCAQRAKFPALMLQPIVENAVRHGVSKRSEGGWVAVRIGCRDGMLEVNVRDNGPGLLHHASTATASGVGLRNTRERLEKLFPERHLFTVLDHPDGGVEVRIAMPLEEVPDGATANA
jgi:two-component system, LytTR family, sensor kinase